MLITKKKQKEMLHAFLAFFIIVTLLFLINLLFIKLSQAHFYQGLSQEVLKVLNKEAMDEGKVQYSISKNLRIPYAFSTSAALFEVKDSVNIKTSYALILRVNTIFGQFPALFLYNKEAGISFLSCLCIEGRMQEMLNEKISLLEKSYWQRRAHDIIVKSISQKDKNIDAKEKEVANDALDKGL